MLRKEPASTAFLIMRQSFNETVIWHRDSYKISPKPNTDNMGKLFVTVFAFAPAPKTDS